MEVDILIDEFTDCLAERKTREQVETEYRLRLTPNKPKDFKGWKFGTNVPNTDWCSIAGSACDMQERGKFDREKRLQYL